MGTVHRIHPGAPGASGTVPSVAAAIAGYLATLDHPETTGTRRVYVSTLRQFVAHLGPDRSLTVLEDQAVADNLVAWFTDRWGQRAPATFNRNLDAVRSAVGYWLDQDWLTGDPTKALRRRGRAPDRTRALSRGDVEQLLTREHLALRERTLWRMLYETAARANEVLALDVPDLDLRNRRAKVTRKGCGGAPPAPRRSDPVHGADLEAPCQVRHIGSRRYGHGKGVPHNRIHFEKGIR